MRKEVVGVILGILLPYIVAIGGTAIIGDKVGNYDFYRSGQLQASDDATSLATLIAYGLGLLVCVPWLWGYWNQLTLKKRLCMSCTSVLVAFLHFVAVFVVRFLFYIHSGGVFP
jgi:hypothetical protein